MATDYVQKRFDAVAQSTTFNNIRLKFDLSQRSVLDIGCTHGEFLEHFGPGSVGLTIIQEEVDEGRKRGLNVKLANIEDPEFSMQNNFDVIYANNIYEHMQSPHNFLVKIKSYLKPGGILILGVPCIPYITPFVYFKKFKGALASLHINFFTRSTLIKSVEYAGWDILDVRGFRFRNFLIDYLLNPIYPHFYVVAKINPNFEYSAKRVRELEGYNNQTK